MNLVYVGLEGGSCAARWEVLRRKFDESAYVVFNDYLFKRGRLGNALENWAYSGAGVKRLNEAVLQEVGRLRPEVVWLDRAVWITPETLRRIRATGAVLVHHTTDCLEPRRLALRWTMRQIHRTIGLYDLALTTNEHDLAWMRAAGVPCAETMMAADGTRFDDRPIDAEARARWASEVLFVGHYEPSNARGVAGLVRAGVPITVYGTSWHKAPRKGRFGGRVNCRELVGEDYAHAIKSAKIALCWLSYWNRNRTTMRSFEIPMCGTFLLAQRTPEHQALYEEGREAEFFGSEGELIEKIRYYLAHDREREAIARRGQVRAAENNRTWEQCVERDWARVRPIVEQRFERMAAVV